MIWMPDVTDMELVREYCARQSETAFETLVHRHINLVYSTALRQVGNPAQAEEITQAVFVILARKAARLRPDAVLAAWLHETARHVATSFLRGEIRRRRREQEAYMQSTLQPSSDESAWEQLAPLLDEAIGRLRTADRDVVALRYFQNKSAHEIAAALNIGEDAVKKRLSRAVEKLRLDFYKRGINVSTAALSGAVLTHSVQAAPAALAKSVTGVALAKGATASTSTLTLIKGALKIMAWTKAKTVGVVGVGVLLVVGTTGVVIQRQHHPATRNDVFRASWAYSGYGDPKSAMMSFFWAIRQADGQQILEACSPGLQQTFQKHFEQQMRASGKPLGEFLAQDAPARFNSTTGIRILKQERAVEDTITLRVFALGEQKEHRITVKKIGEEWKVDGVGDLN